MPAAAGNSWYYFVGATDLGRVTQNILQTPTAQIVGYSNVPTFKAAILLRAFAMTSGAGDRNARHCLQCGKPIVHRRITAFYCSGKCREIHNAQRRRIAREEAKTDAPPTATPEADNGI